MAWSICGTPRKLPPIDFPAEIARAADITFGAPHASFVPQTPRSGREGVRFDPLLSKHGNVVRIATACTFVVLVLGASGIEFTKASSSSASIRVEGDNFVVTAGFDLAIDNGSGSQDPARLEFKHLDVSREGDILFTWRSSKNLFDQFPELELWRPDLEQSVEAIRQREREKRFGARSTPTPDAHQVASLQESPRVHCSEWSRREDSPNSDPKSHLKSSRAIGRKTTRC